MIWAIFFLDLLFSLTFQLDETFYYYVLRHFLAPELYVVLLLPVHSQISAGSKAQRVGLGVRNQKKLTIVCQASSGLNLCSRYVGHQNFVTIEYRS